MTLTTLLFSAVVLTGVTGGHLKTRAYFDAYNVKVGDPLVLTVDFVGSADFAALHPPALGKLVDRRDWKLDDSSAKTDTFSDGRRLVYRVRPMREGVLWFPAFEFEYETPTGEKRTVRSNEIPVHAHGGAQVVVEEMGEDVETMPEPPELVVEPPQGVLSPDLEFDWRRVCASPTADGFAAFDFPEARMNEATMAIREGNWARALKVYSRLEWRVGQTPGIERGILAALALKYDNPAVELPVWRVVGRPVLRYAALGRVSLVLGGIFVVALVFFLLGRLIRLLACVAFALALLSPSSANAQDPFEEMERMIERQRQQMNVMMNGASVFNMSGPVQPKVVASFSVSKRDLTVGEPFEFVVSVETSRGSTLSGLQLEPSEMFGMTLVGKVTSLADAPARDPSNVVHRLSVPVRYDVPFRGNLSFVVRGQISSRTEVGRGRGRSVMSFSTSFREETPALPFEVRPLSGADQPADFSGIVSAGLVGQESCDLTTVSTNDVIQITYRIRTDGYLPPDWMPDGAAFEIGRSKDGFVEWRRFFVADGAPETPRVRVSYYDPKTKKYRYLSLGGTHVSYK